MIINEYDKREIHARSNRHFVFGGRGGEKLFFLIAEASPSRRSGEASMTVVRSSGLRRGTRMFWDFMI
jgi:hypothetical protein